MTPRRAAPACWASLFASLALAATSPLAHAAPPKAAAKASAATPAAASKAAASSAAGAPGAPSLTEHEGSSVETPLSGGPALNAGSPLKRRNLFLLNPALPAHCAEGFDVRPTQRPGSGADRGEAPQFLYHGQCPLQVEAALEAYELRYLLFDVFGNHLRTVSSAAIVPMEEGGSYLIETAWPLPTEREASLHFSTVAYIAQLRLEDGTTLKANPRLLLNALRARFPELKESALEPTATP